MSIRRTCRRFRVVWPASLLAAFILSASPVLTERSPAAAIKAWALTHPKWHHRRPIRRVRIRRAPVPASVRALPLTIRSKPIPKLKPVVAAFIPAPEPTPDPVEAAGPQDQAVPAFTLSGLMPDGPDDILELPAGASAAEGNDANEASALKGTLAYWGWVTDPKRGSGQAFYFRHYSPAPDALSRAYGVGPTWNLWDYHYSDNGRYLFFKHGMPGYGCAIHRLDLKTGIIVPSRNVLRDEASYSPDGRYVALTVSYGDLGRNLDGGFIALEVFDFDTKSGHIVLKSWDEYSNQVGGMAWTPQDTLLYENVAATPPPGSKPEDADSYTTPGLWEFNPATGVSRPVLSGAGFPVVSPDGIWVVVRSDSPVIGAPAETSDKFGNRNESFTAWLWNRATNQRWSLGVMPYAEAKWTPDGRQIILLKPNFGTAHEPGEASTELDSLPLYQIEQETASDNSTALRPAPLATLHARNLIRPTFGQSDYFRLERVDESHVYVRIQEFLGLEPNNSTWKRDSIITAVNWQSGKVTQLAQANDPFGAIDWLPDPENPLLADQLAITPLSEKTAGTAPVTATPAPPAPPHQAPNR